MYVGRLAADPAHPRRPAVRAGAGDGRRPVVAAEPARAARATGWSEVTWHHYANRPTLTACSTPDVARGGGRASAEAPPVRRALPVRVEEVQQRRQGRAAARQRRHRLHRLAGRHPADRRDARAGRLRAAHLGRPRLPGRAADRLLHARSSSATAGPHPGPASTPWRCCATCPAGTLCGVRTTAAPGRAGQGLGRRAPGDRRAVGGGRRPGRRRARRPGPRRPARRARPDGAASAGCRTGAAAAAAAPASAARSCRPAGAVRRGSQARCRSTAAGCCWTSSPCETVRLDLLRTPPRRRRAVRAL